MRAVQVALAERLKLALDPETKFDIYREMFTEVSSSPAHTQPPNKGELKTVTRLAPC